MEERNQLLQLLAREREKTAALEKQIQALEAKTNRSEDLGRLLDKVISKVFIKGVLKRTNCLSNFDLIKL